MPVNIYRVTPDEEENEPIAWLCDGERKLAPQIDARSGSSKSARAYRLPHSWRTSAFAGVVMRLRAARRWNRQRCAGWKIWE